MDKIEAKGVRFKTQIHHSETQLTFNFFWCHNFHIVKKKIVNCFSLLILILNIASITLDPDPNSMYLNPQYRV